MIRLGIFFCRFSLCGFYLAVFWYWFPEWRMIFYSDFSIEWQIIHFKSKLAINKIKYVIHQWCVEKLKDLILQQIVEK